MVTTTVQRISASTVRVCRCALGVDGGLLPAKYGLPMSLLEAAGQPSILGKGSSTVWHSTASLDEST